MLTLKRIQMLQNDECEEFESTRLLNLDSWISLINHEFNKLLTCYDRMYE